MPRRADTGLQELPFAGIYRADPDGRLTLLVDDFIVPNGLAFSPDERLLHITDSWRQRVHVFGVRPDGSLAGGQIVASVAGAETGVADGMKVARDGVVSCAGAGGIWVVQPDGRFLGRARLAEQPSNLAWGGGDWRDLYVTARSSVDHIRMAVSGVPAPKRSPRATR
jgi:gluconolactonase